MSNYYIAARSGESWEGKTLHGDSECSELDGPTRPVSDSVAGEDADLCECVPFGDASGGESNDTGEKAPDSSESDSSTDEGNGSDEGNGDTEDTSAPTCAGTTSGGDSCSREVDEEGEFCFQHSE